MPSSAAAVSCIQRKLMAAKTSKKMPMDMNSADRVTHLFWPWYFPFVFG